MGIIYPFIFQKKFKLTLKNFSKTFILIYKKIILSIEFTIDCNLFDLHTLISIFKWIEYYFMFIK